MNQKTALIVISLLTVGLLAFYWKGSDGPIVNINNEINVKTNDPTIVKKFTVNGPGELSVTTSGGSIAVEGGNGNEVVAEVFIRKQGKILDKSDSEVQNITEGYEFRMEQSGNNIELFAKRKVNAFPWKRISFSFVVSVPKAMANKLRTSGGSIKLAGVDGPQKMSTSGGSINIKEVVGEVDANTSGGSISVNNQKGQLDLNTSGGSINITDAEGDIDAGTSGGSIRLNNVKGKVDVGTSGGSIYIEGVTESVRASTSGGKITADISGLTKQISLRTSGGSIYATLPKGKGMDLNLSGSKVNIDLQNFSGSAKKGRINGSMHGGGMPVNMSTSGGSVNIKFK